MSGHISISVAEVADRIAIRELVEAKYGPETSDLFRAYNIFLS